MNGVERFYRWIKTLPPPLQTLYYALETAGALAVGTFLMHLGSAIDIAINDPLHVFHFDWGPQLRLLELSFAGGAVKGLIDCVKMIFGAGPTQLPPLPKGAPDGA